MSYRVESDLKGGWRIILTSKGDLTWAQARGKVIQDLLGEIHRLREGIHRVEAMESPLMDDTQIKVELEHF